MAVRCVRCGYTMRTNQEIQSAVVKAGYDFKEVMFGFLKFLGFGMMSTIMGGHLNTGPHAVPCPKCNEKNAWEDA